MVIAMSRRTTVLTLVFLAGVLVGSAATVGVFLLAAEPTRQEAAQQRRQLEWHLARAWELIEREVERAREQLKTERDPRVREALQGLLDEYEAARKEAGPQR